MERGFTLLEAMITMLIVALVIVSGAPALTHLAERTRINGEHDRMLSGIRFARSLAVNSASRAVICPSADHQVCLSDPEWHHGWIIFVDDDRDREHDPDETIYLVGNPAEEGVSITSSRSRRRIEFLPTGMAFGSNVTLRICTEHRDAPARSIIVANTGRTRSGDLPAAACS